MRMTAQSDKRSGLDDLEDAVHVGVILLEIGVAQSYRYNIRREPVCQAEKRENPAKRPSARKKNAKKAGKTRKAL